MGEAPSETRKPLWLMYFPRAAHHLFMRMFSGHEELHMIEALRHMDGVVPSTIQLSDHSSLESAQEECKKLCLASQSGFEKWTADIFDTEKGQKRVLNSYSVAFHISPAAHSQYLNERLGRTRDEPTASPGLESPDSLQYWHLDPERTSPTNPTIFTDSFLKSHIPILLIRHPILAFPSTMRAASAYFLETGGIGNVFMNIILRYRWHVMLYDWYAEHHREDPSGTSEPLVLDADDLMYDKDAVAELCRRAGLDPSKTKYEWPKTQVAVTYAKEDRFIETLANSESVVPGKSSKGVSVGKEIGKWQAEFGEERAELLRHLVEGAMEDYNFLKLRSMGALLKKQGQ